MKNKKISKKWIAVYTKPRHEKKVEKELWKKGFEVYLPLLKEKRKWSDRKKWVRYPLFRSYVFVKTEFKNVIFLLKTFGIVNVVKFGNEIAVIQEDQLKAIQTTIDNGFIPRPVDYFVKGNNAEVTTGSLKGLKGEVIRMDNQDRLLIRVDAIRHSISIQINRAYLKQI